MPAQESALIRACLTTLWKTALSPTSFHSFRLTSPNITAEAEILHVYMFLLYCLTCTYAPKRHMNCLVHCTMPSKCSSSMVMTDSIRTWSVFKVRISKMNYVQVLKSWRNTDCKTGHTHKYITLPKDKNNAKHNMMKQKVERAKKKNGFLHFSTPWKEILPVSCKLATSSVQNNINPILHT